MLKRLISLLIACALVFSAVILTSADTLSDLQNQQAELEKEAEKYEAIIDEKQNEIDEQQEYVDALTSKIAVVNNEIAVIRNKIGVYDTQISEKTEKINELNVQAEDNMNLLRQRLKAIYLAGDASAIEIVLGAKDFSDFVDKVQLVESLSEYDANLIDDIESQLDGINTEIESLNSDKASLEKENKTLDVKQSELNGLLDKNQVLLAELYGEKEEFDEKLYMNQVSQSALEGEIQAYYAEQERLEQERLEQERLEQERLEQENQDNEDPADEEDNDEDTSSGSDNIGSSVSGSGGYVWPVPGYYDLSSDWAEDRGYSHGGVDIAGPGIMGATVVAADGGTVVTSCNECSHNWGKYGSCGCGGGYGNYVWIDHGNGKATVYAHLSYTTVYEGQTVSPGEVLGYIGSTGYSTGPHLHYEARYYGERYNPMTEH